MISTHIAAIRPGVTKIETAPFDGIEGDAPRGAAAGAPLLAWIAERLHRGLDRLIAASSEVSDDPILDVRDFPWTATLRADWRAIRAETAGLGDAATLWANGDATEAAVAGCPVTARLLAEAPGLDSAAIAVLAPGAHAPERRGATKRRITCHLGLVVPRDGDVRMRIADRVVRWAEGETLLFDDTCRHEAWNEAGGPRVVLALRFARPLRRPGKWLADFVARLARDGTAEPHAAS